MSNYTDENFKINNELTLPFPIEKLIDEYMSKLFKLNINFDTMSKEEIKKLIYTDKKLKTGNDGDVVSFMETFMKMFILFIGNFSMQIKKTNIIYNNIKNTTNQNITTYTTNITNINAIMSDIKSFLNNTSNWIAVNGLSEIDNTYVFVPEFYLNVLSEKLKIPKVDKNNKNYTISEKEKADLKLIQDKISSSIDNLNNTKLNIGIDFDEINSMQTSLIEIRTRYETAKQESINDPAKVEQFNIIKTEFDNNIITFNSKIDSIISKVGFNYSGNTIFQELKTNRAELQNKLADYPSTAMYEVSKDLFNVFFDFVIYLLVDKYKQFLIANVKMYGYDTSSFDTFKTSLYVTPDSIKNDIFKYIELNLTAFSKFYNYAKPKIYTVSSEELMKEMKSKQYEISGLQNNEENTKKLTTTLTYFNMMYDVVQYLPDVLSPILKKIYDKSLE